MPFVLSLKMQFLVRINHGYLIFKSFMLENML